MTSDDLICTVSVEWRALLERELRASNLRTSAAIRAAKELYGQEQQPLEVYSVADDGVFEGGLAGYTWLGWLHIDLLWVRSAGRGLGSRLLTRAEELAVARGCAASRVETWDFQAPGFYVRHGYQTVAEVSGYPEGATDHILVKHF